MLPTNKWQQKEEEIRLQLSGLEKKKDIFPWIAAFQVSIPNNLNLGYFQFKFLPQTIHFSTSAHHLHFLEARKTELGSDSMHLLK